MTQVAEHPDTRASTEPTERRWTRKEYYRLAEEGFFNGQRVELIEGRIIQMPPQGLPQTLAIELVDRYARHAFGNGYRNRVQMQFRAADGSDPEPDLLVVPGNPRDPADGHPTTATLIVEVSDTTLRHDRRKARLCAASGIRDYWILNLLDGVLEVRRDPMANPADGVEPFASVQVLNREQSIAPLGAANAPVKVADLLP